MFARNERIPHVMGRAIRTQYPSNFLFFDTETKGRINPNDHSESLQELWFGEAMAFRYEHLRRTREESCHFSSISEYWAFVRKRLDKNRPLYVFAHNSPFDLTIVDFWRYTEEQNFQTELVVLESPPFIVKGKLHGKTIIFLDTLNYWRTSLASLGESLGIPKLEMPPKNAPFAKWTKYCRNDVGIIANAVCELIRFLVENDLGKFSFTLASQSMMAYRHRFMEPHKIYVHNNEKVLQLEREGYYGGLVHCFYIGRVQGRVYHYDINSLYPFCMQNPVPVRLVGTKSNPTNKDVSNRLRTLGGVARVLVQTNNASYPVRHSNRLIEAQGTYWTVLPGPELKEALERDEILKVESIAYYEMDTIFDQFVDYFYKMRQEYKKQGNQEWQYFCKILMNSLYGKFGQHANDWHELTAENLKVVYDEVGVQMPKAYTQEEFAPTLNWKQNNWWPCGLPFALSIRAFAGVTQFRYSTGEHYESCPIISAYVTSYARTLLRSYMDVAGCKHVYYVDTDSLFVDRVGRRNLQSNGLIGETALGKLKYEGESSNCEFWCPKDYRIGDKIVSKGIRKDAIQIGPNEFMQNQFEGTKSILRREPLPYIGIKWITKENRREYTKGKVTRNGWVEYLQLDQA